VKGIELDARTELMLSVGAAVAQPVNEMLALYKGWPHECNPQPKFRCRKLIFIFPFHVDLGHPSFVFTSRLATNI
jgi:hypothetical protein